MKPLKKYIFIVILIFSDFAHSQNTGNDLLRYCNSFVKHSNGEQLSSVEEIEALTCNQYIIGFMDSLTLTGDVQKKACVPGEVMSDQIARVVVKYLIANPEFLHKTKGAILLYSLEKGFPCNSR